MREVERLALRRDLMVVESAPRECRTTVLPPERAWGSWKRSGSYESSITPGSPEPASIWLSNGPTRTGRTWRRRRSPRRGCGSREDRPPSGPRAISVNGVARLPRGMRLHSGSQETSESTQPSESWAVASRGHAERAPDPGRRRLSVAVPLQPNAVSRCPLAVGRPLGARTWCQLIRRARSRRRRRLFWRRTRSAPGPS
jgi:hypothetical protein